MVRENVEGVMMAKTISRKLKGKFMYSCAVPAIIYGLVTLALSEQQHHNLLQVCKKKWIRRMTGIKRAEGRKLNDLR